MRRQSHKRHQGQNYMTSHKVGRPIENSEPTYMYRRVSEESSELLNRATHGIRGKGIFRIVDNFSMTVVYPGKIRRLHARSPLDELPTAPMIAEGLGGVAVASLRRPVEATVRWISPLRRSLAVIVSYPEYAEEQRALGLEVNSLLQLEPGFEPAIGPSEDPHIGIAKGVLDKAQVNQIVGRLPKGLILGLGPVENTNGPI